MSSWVWQVLGIARTDDKSAIRKAYADKLRAIDPDRDAAAFARLRQARDQALREVARAAQAAAPPELTEDALADFDPLDSFAEDLPETPELTAGPAVEPEPAAPPTQEQEAADLLRALARLVFPGGEYSDEGFLRPDYEEALRLVGALLEHARTGTLELHNAIDNHLASMFAEGWPRSAALVDEPAAEFAWLDESGTLDERPALRFLNLRIRGMKFHEMVQEPGHSLNKAWTELSRPGDPTRRDRKRVPKKDVATLLEGIRARYPEVESYLNPERVAYWERHLAGAEPGGGGGESRFTAWIVVAGIAAFVRLAAAFGGDHDSTTVPPVNVEQQDVQGIFGGSGTPLMSEQARQAEYREAVATIFGGQFHEPDLYMHAPALAQALRRIYNNGPIIAADADQRLARARELVRQFAIATRANAGFDELVAVAAMRRNWLRSMQADDKLGADCPMLSANGGEVGNVTLDDDALRREQATLRMLVSSRLMAEQPQSRRLSAEVPGDLIEEAATNAGMTPDQIGDAMASVDSPQRCRADLGMIEAVLRNPARASADLLRIL